VRAPHIDCMPIVADGINPAPPCTKMSNLFQRLSDFYRLCQGRRCCRADTIVGFEHRHEAEQFFAYLKARLARFGLALHPDKTAALGSTWGAYALWFERLVGGSDRAEMGQGDRVAQQPRRSTLCPFLKNGTSIRIATSI
jgi:hypothetical protein